MHEICVIKHCIFLKLVYQNKNELPGTSMVSTMIVSRFEKSRCLLKSSVPFPDSPTSLKHCQQDGTDKRAYSHIHPLNPVSSLWTWHFKDGVYATNFPFP